SIVVPALHPPAATKHVSPTNSTSPISNHPPMHDILQPRPRKQHLHRRNLARNRRRPRAHLRLPLAPVQAVGGGGGGQGEGWNPPGSRKCLPCILPAWGTSLQQQPVRTKTLLIRF